MEEDEEERSFRTAEMKTLRIEHGWRLYMKNHAWFEFSCRWDSVALPLSLFWLNQGYGYEKAVLVRFLFFSFTYNNGKVPF